MKNKPYPQKAILRDTILVLFIFSAFMFFRNYSATLTEGLEIEPETINLGRLTCGEERQVTFQLMNKTKKSIVFLGQNVSCSCISLDKSPMEIAPGETITVSAHIEVFEDYPYSEYRQFVKYMVEESGKLTIRPIFFVGSVDKANVVTEASPLAVPTSFHHK